MKGGRCRSRRRARSSYTRSGLWRRNARGGGHGAARRFRRASWTRLTQYRQLRPFVVQDALIHPRGAWETRGARVPAKGQIYHPDRPQKWENSRWGHRTTRGNQKKLEFLQLPMAGPRGAGGMGASGPHRPRPKPTTSCDNLARLVSALGLKCLHLIAHMTPAC